MSTATPAPTTPARVFGRCTHKGCTTRVVLDPAHDSRVSIEGSWVTVAAEPRTVLDGGALIGGRGMVFCATKHESSAGMIHHLLTFGAVKGKLTADPCGPRCWNATTAVCKCSCGGAEHGSTA